MLICIFFSSHHRIQRSPNDGSRAVKLHHNASYCSCSQMDETLHKIRITTKNTQTAQRCCWLALAPEACPYNPLHIPKPKTATSRDRTIAAGADLSLRFALEVFERHHSVKASHESQSSNTLWHKVHEYLFLCASDDFSCWFLLDHQHLQKLFHSVLTLITSELPGSGVAPS